MTSTEQLVLSELTALRNEVGAVRDDVAELRVQVAHLEAGMPAEASRARGGGLARAGGSAATGATLALVVQQVLEHFMRSGP